MRYSAQEKAVIDHVSFGNKKLPKTTCIFNSGSATNCPSKALGLCQAGGKCYALKAERMYSNCLPYRERQAKLWLEVSPSDFANALLKYRSFQKRPFNAFRFNESGDFAGQEHLEWFADVCHILSSHGVTCYGYTARTDLNIEPLLLAANVNVSNDHGNWIDRGATRFRMVTEYSGKLRCAGDCRKCTLCTGNRAHGRTIEVLVH